MAINVRREENPLLVKNSHIAPQNQEDYKMAKNFNYDDVPVVETTGGSRKWIFL